MPSSIPVETPMIAFAFKGNVTYAAGRDGTVYRQGRETYAATGFILATRGYAAGVTSASEASDMLTALIRAQRL